MQETLLDVQNLTVSFDEDEIIDDLSFSVNKGNVIAIVGPNGAGKSVLFRALLGLIPYLGKIEWLPGLKISYVPQKFNIEKDFPLTTREFLHLKSKDPNKMLAALESVGLKNKQTEMHHIQHHLLDQRLGWLS